MKALEFCCNEILIINEKSSIYPEWISFDLFDGIDKCKYLVTCTKFLNFNLVSPLIKL
jgi:hypothetical protein